MIVSKASINNLARLDATVYEVSADEPNYTIPQQRYEAEWMQNLYEEYFWLNLRELRSAKEF